MAAPTLTGVDDSTFAENTVNATPQIIDADVAFADPDEDFAGGALTVSGLLAEDTVSVRHQGSGPGLVGYDSNTGEVTYGGAIIGYASGGAGGTLTITFTAAATSAAVDALLQNLTYANGSDTPTASRQLFVNVTDSTGADLGQTAEGVGFTVQTGLDNPLSGIDVGSYASPAFFDFDSDGDLDFLAGDADGALRLFDNNDADTGFTELTGGANPFAGIDVGMVSHPTFMDVDGDGDLDLVVGNYHGNVLLYDNNDGDAGFTQRVGGANPFGGVDMDYLAVPTATDLDNDGDQDLVIAGTHGVFAVFDNNDADAGFTQLGGGSNPIPADYGHQTAAVFTDVDGDGDADMVLGDHFGGLRLYDNNDADSGFTELTGAANPFAAVAVGLYSAPTFVDMDGDGDQDLVVGAADGTFTYVENVSVRGAPVTVTVTAQNDAPTLTGLAASVTFAENLVNATPQLLFGDVTVADGEGNWNGGSLQISTGVNQDRFDVGGPFSSSPGSVFYDDGLGGGPVAIGTWGGGAGGYSVAFNANATSAIIELLIENITYANASDTPVTTRTLTINLTDGAGADLIPDVGPAVTGVSPLTGADNPFAFIDTGDVSKVDLFDFDNDGDLDLVAGGYVGLHLYENDGGVFTEVLDPDNPFSALTFGARVDPVFMDFDNDGDLDLVVGNENGQLRAYDNTGGVFTQLFGASNPFNGIDVGLVASPASMDLDGDGDADLVVGERFGTLLAWRNGTDGAAGAFSALTGGDNPFDGIDVTNLVTPTFVDIDGDGDEDLVAGENNGWFFTYQNDGGVFTQLTGGTNPLDSADVGFYSAPAFADMDGDGDLDLISGDRYGNVYLFENTTAAPSAPTLTLNVTPETDAIVGSGGAETLTGTSDGELIQGLAGNDVLKGNDGDDTLEGGDNDDTLVGGNGADDLLGGAGNDELNGGAGADDMTGGAGDDFYTTDGLDTLTETSGEGTDTVRSSVGLTLGANFENLLLSGSADTDGVGNGENNILTGNVGNNALRGLGGADTLNGQAGDDALFGGDGVDTLNGGNDNDQLFGGADNDVLNGGNGSDMLNGEAGADSMSGGAGNDNYVVDDAADTVIEGLGLGLDTVITDLGRYTLSANVEYLIGVSVLRQTLTGNAERNTIIAGSSADTLNGHDGNDRVIGNGGNDRMTGGLGADTFVVLDSDMARSTVGGGQQVDVVMDFNVGEGDRIDLSAIDANIGIGGDQAFTFVSSFTKHAGEGRLAYNAGTNVTTLQLDIDGDGKADYQIQLKGGDFTHSPIVLAGDPANLGGWVL